METVWDWIAVLAFGGLIVLMLSRSSEETPSDHLMEYFVPAVGCAVANYIGNNYSDVGAAIAIALVGAYIYKVLKWPSREFIARIRGGSGKQ